MSRPTSTRDLRASERAFVAAMSDLGFGRFEYLRIERGELVLDLWPTVVRDVKFGSGNKAATGLVRLPNSGAVKWRKADGSGDLGLALNAADHLVADAVIDFAPGQTFGAFSYPDTGYGNKGIVQIDPAGGLSIESGVLSMAASGASPGTYSKVTVDAKGPRDSRGESHGGRPARPHAHGC